MPVTSTAVIVGTSITVVSAATVGVFDYDRNVHLQSGTNNALTYIGGSNVSVTNGLLLRSAALAEKTNLVIHVKADDVIYAISDTVGAVVRVVEVK
jgi:hypothetical protein